MGLCTAGAFFSEEKLKIEVNNETEKRILEYLDRERINTDIREGIAGPFSSGFVFDEEELLRCAEVLREDIRKSGRNYNKDQAVMAMMVIDQITENLGVEGEELPVPDTVIDKIVEHSKVFHEGDFGENPYLKNISFDRQSSGDFTLTHGAYEPYEGFHYNTPVSEFRGILIPRLGTFTYRQEFPCISEKDVTWMSVTPNEIYTMEKHINEASGKVLTLGLGMGYYTYMVSIKDDVESVTVIEKSQDVIDLFKKYILPQFSHPEKINILCDDAFKFIDTVEDGEYDCCFADIWKGNNDILPYLELKIACERFRRMKVTYWIEDALSAAVMSYVFVSILDDFCSEKGIRLPDTAALPEDEKFKHGFVAGLLMEQTINRAQDVDYFMSYENICSLL